MRLAARFSGCRCIHQGGALVVRAMRRFRNEAEQEQVEHVLTSYEAGSFLVDRFGAGLVIDRTNTGQSRSSIARTRARCRYRMSSIILQTPRRRWLGCRGVNLRSGGRGNQIARMTPEERARDALELAERVRRRLAEAKRTIEHEPRNED